jgi:CDP-paratose 2-epimerase
MADLDRPVLIVGGAGFIGCSLAARLAHTGLRVRVFDDLSRPGGKENLEWLQSEYGDHIEAQIADVRSRDAVRAAVDDVQAVFHFAAQVAVTTSFEDPRRDFEINARGTFELVDALRLIREPPPLIFTSTNKVYGMLADIGLEQRPTRWHPTELGFAARGIDEKRPLAFNTPFGCSKGCAEQYVLDYARIFGLPATVFRMSCVYGPRQRGSEDQGWISHFAREALEGKSLTIYGDGRQVRDVLFIDDLVEAFLHAWKCIGTVRGHAFNVGGGPSNTLSLLELVELLERLIGHPLQLRFDDWRPGDQRYYVSDPTAFTSATGWRPRVGPHTGVEALYGWLVDRRGATAPMIA